MTEWRPIDTAPEGRILVFNPYVGVYCSERVEGEFPLRLWGGRAGDWYPVPTLWALLPEPPEGE